MDRSGSEKAKWNEIGELQDRKTEGVPYNKKKYYGGVMVYSSDGITWITI